MRFLVSVIGKRVIHSEFMLTLGATHRLSSENSTCTETLAIKLATGTTTITIFINITINYNVIKHIMTRILFCYYRRRYSYYHILSPTKKPFTRFVNISLTTPTPPNSQQYQLSLTGTHTHTHTQTHTRARARKM